MQIALSFGSNLGNRQANIERAAVMLAGDARLELTNIKLSSFYQAPALLKDDSPSDWDKPYLNLVMVADMMGEISPHDLLLKLKMIEHDLGRSHDSEIWSPREIDIDILYFGDKVISGYTLTIPHKELFNRNFILQPLAEVMPNWLGDNSKDVEYKKHLLPKLEIYSKAKNIAELVEIYRPKLTKIIGILNITPDSFSDGGASFSADDAIAHAQQLIADGADIIDIGAESTRPNATPLTADAEWQRLENILPKIIKIAHKAGKQVSVDTYHPTTVKKAIALDVDIINDVSGLQNPAMIEVVKNSDCKLVLMHSLSVPADNSLVMDKNLDIIEELCNFACNSITRLHEHGIDMHRLVFDAGIGFGKTAEQSLEIILRIDELKKIGLPIYIGHSPQVIPTNFQFSKRQCHKRRSDIGIFINVDEFRR